LSLHDALPIWGGCGRTPPASTARGAGPVSGRPPVGPAGCSLFLCGVRRLAVSLAEDPEGESREGGRAEGQGEPAPACRLPGLLPGIIGNGGGVRHVELCSESG